MTSAEAAATANGRGAATLLAAAVGYGAMGVLALAGDAMSTVAKSLTFWLPTGALSGVTTIAIAVWLFVWWLLTTRWRDRNLNMAVIVASSGALMLVGLLLTFPPFMDFLQGK